MTVRHDNFTLPRPGQAKNLGTVGATVLHFDMETLFGAGWNRGQMFTLSCTNAFYALVSDSASSDIAPASVDGSSDEPAGPFAANEHYRFFFQDVCRYLHVVRVSADGNMRIWNSSAMR